MTYIRGIFLFALIMLIIGVLGGRYIVSSMFASPVDSWTPIPAPTSVADAAGITPTATATAATTPTGTPLASPTAQATATATSVATVTPIPTLTPSPTAGATATVTLTSTATTGIVTLSRYYVAASTARPGQTIALGYVIDNPTAHTVQVGLGASMKLSSSLSWAASLADPSHDVVAIAPPGISTHTRFFTLPLGARAGSYDVAWGLKDAVTGQRLALTSATGALIVH